MKPKSNSDAAQKSELVPQNKRIAMGVHLNGQSQGSKGGNAPKAGGLASLKKK